MSDWFHWNNNQDQGLMKQLKRGDLVYIQGRKPAGLGVVMDSIIGVGDFTDDYYYITWIIIPGDVHLGSKGW